MVWKLLVVLVCILMAVFLLFGPTIAETTAAGVCDLVDSLEC